MSSLKPAPILAFLVLAPLFAACKLPAAENSNTSNAAVRNAAADRTVNDKAEELGMLILMPAEAVEVAWREEDQGGGKKRLVAVMRFEAADAAKIAEGAAKFKPPVTGELETEVWFPQELIAQSEMGEGSKLRGQEYAADIVLQSPYRRGRLVRIENTDYFFLEAFTQ